MRSSSWIPLIALMIFSALTLLQPNASADLPQFDAGDSSGVSLVVTFHAETDLVESGSSLPVTVIVTTHYGTPVHDATVEILADGAVATPSTGSTSYDGSFSFSYSANVKAERHLLIVVKAFKTGTNLGVGRMVAVVMPPVGGGVSDIPVASALGLTLLASIGLAGTEYGRYSLFKILIFPLYSRIKKDEVLDHFVRGQIYGYIRANPGVHFNLLKSSLKVNNGSLAHHLRTLEMQGFVRSKRDGIFKRFFPLDVDAASEEGIKLSDLQARILDMINDGDGCTQTEIARRLNVSQQAVSYNLRLMSHEGVVNFERAGRERRYFIAAA